MIVSPVVKKSDTNVFATKESQKKLVIPANFFLAGRIEGTHCEKNPATLQKYTGCVRTELGSSLNASHSLAVVVKKGDM